MNFGIIGVGGYIAPKHLQAIKDTGHTVVAALDPFDSVGILDRYFFDTKFFTEELEFLNYIQESKKVDYVSICSPDYLHTRHCIVAMEAGANVICEKPLVTNPKDLDMLGRVEGNTGKRVYNVLQLRYHPKILKLKNTKWDKKAKVKVTYVTPRGDWFLKSWRGDPFKQAGLASTIGIHLFDFLLWIFGDVTTFSEPIRTDNLMSGYLNLENADVEWLLSTDKEDLPKSELRENNIAYRVITMGREEIIDFSKGFTKLHTKVYKEILKGNGYGIEDVRPAIELVSKF